MCACVCVAIKRKLLHGAEGKKEKEKREMMEEEHVSAIPCSGRSSRLEFRSVEQAYI